MSNTYPLGNIARLSCTFTDATGVPADPTTVQVTIHPPTGSVMTLTPVKDATGVYHYDVALDRPGVWGYRFIGSGVVTAQSSDGQFIVPQLAF